MAWRITFSNRAAKQAARLRQRERDLLGTLVRDLELSGPVQPGWPNYSRLSAYEYHCHLGYRWVACWRLQDDELQVIEIYYTGSREKCAVLTK